MTPNRLQHTTRRVAQAVRIPCSVWARSFDLPFAFSGVRALCSLRACKAVQGLRLYYKLTVNRHKAVHLCACAASSTCSRGSMAPGKKRDPWGSSRGWKAVEVPDDFLLGAEEGGFAGLEILEDPTIITTEAAPDFVSQPAEEDSKPSKKKQKQPKDKQKQQAAAAAAATPDSSTAAAAAGQQTTSSKKNKRKAAGTEVDVTALQQQIAQLQAENAALKRKSLGPAVAAAAGGAEDGDANQPKRKKARKDTTPAAAATGAGDCALIQQQQQQPEQQQPDIDMSEWASFCLHPLLLKGLGLQGFSAPTPIQAAVLPAAVRDRRDIIGAAQTGSGKTLAFGLPILQLLLQEREQQLLQQEQQAGGASEHGGEGGGVSLQDLTSSSRRGGTGKLRALILAPTRELALQVCNHLQQLGKVARIRVIPLVGGIATIKQERLLRSRPPVVVATPGRCWDLMTSGATHLVDFSELSFLVLDEADRMVQQGHYQELNNILELIPHPAKQQEDEQQAAAAEATGDFSKTQRRRQREQQAVLRRDAMRKGKRGRQEPAAEQDAQQQEEERDEEEEEQVVDGSASEEEDLQQGELSGSDEEAEEGSEGEQGADAAAEDGSSSDQEQQPPAAAADGTDELGLVQPDSQQQQQQRKQLLQTFVFSATLALPAHLHKRLRKGGGGSSGAASLDNLMNRVAFRGRPAVVDLTPAAKVAERVTEAQVSVLDEEREALLYYLLAKHPGRALVFVNAVSSVRRLAALLQLLGMPSYALHAQQQQRQRLKALDRFKSNPHGVLVATDVAARGLDIPNVNLVIHYQLPASADVYIHRSGRTARTGGVDGLSLALVAPKELPRWRALMRALAREQLPPSFPLEPRVVAQAQQRMTLAKKIDDVQRKQRKEQADRNWAASQAAAVGVDLSDDEEAAAAAAAAERGPKGKRHKGGKAAAGAGGDASDLQRSHQQAALTAEEQRRLTALQRELAIALAAPLQASFSSRYFTGGASAACAAAVGAGEGGAAGSVVPTAAVAATVQQAARLAATRMGKDAGGTGAAHVGAVAGLSRKAQRNLLQQQQRAALAGSGRAAARGRKGAQKPDLQRLLMSKNELKRQKRSQGMVVVGGGRGAVVFGRDTLGPSALQVLKGASAGSR